jgi:hypothetical protein
VDITSARIRRTKMCVWLIPPQALIILTHSALGVDHLIHSAFGVDILTSSAFGVDILTSSAFGVD